MLLNIIFTATKTLALLTSKVLTAARKLKNTLFHEALEKEYGNKAVIKAEDTVDIVTALAKKTITEPELPVSPITATVPKPEVAEQPKTQIPPRPVMPPEAAAFSKLLKVKTALDKQNNLIFEAESERNKLEIKLNDLKGLARLTKKKELESRIAIKTRKSEPSKPDYRESSDCMDLQRYRTSTQHSIPHSVPQTHTKKHVPSGKKPTEKSLRNLKPYTKRYNDIKKRLTSRTSTDLTKAEIKGRDKIAPLHCVKYYNLKQRKKL